MTEDSHKKRMSKSERKAWKKGTDLEVDLTVVAASGETLFSATSLHFGTIVKTIRDAVEVEHGICVDALLYGEKPLVLSQTLDKAGIPSGATLHAVVGSLHGHFGIWLLDPDVLMSVDFCPGDRRALEEKWKIMKEDSDLTDLVTVSTAEENRRFLENEGRLQLKDEWQVTGVDAKGNCVLGHVQPPKQSEYAYPIQYSLKKTVTKVTEITEGDGHTIFQLLCTPGMYEKDQTFRTVLAKVPHTGERLTNIMLHAKSAVLFRYTERRGGIGDWHQRSINGCLVFVAGHLVSLSETYEGHY